VPIAVDDACPLVGTHEVADVHVGYGVAVDLVSVVDGVAEGDEGGEEAVERPEATQPVGEAGGFRRVGGHEAGEFLRCVFFIIADGGLAGDKRVVLGVELVWELQPRNSLSLSRRAISIGASLFNKPSSTNVV